jgi:acyl-CoA thioesterase FadM
MYPFLRLATEFYLFHNVPPLEVGQAHVSHHTCMPWDLDPWVELNNGRTLTLYDLGRVPFGARVGMHRVLRQQGWGMTVAGSTVRYRRRVRAFDRIEMHTRCIGWDSRFLYIEQSMWRHGECTSHVLIRSAVTSAQGIVAPVRMIEALGGDPVSPALPGWVAAWIAADAQRPWPPMRGTAPTA